MPSPKPTYVSQPFLGLWLDLPAWQGDPRSLTDCLNVIIRNGAVTNYNMGWTDTGVQLNGPVTLIAMFPTNNSVRLVLGTPTDLYDWHNGTPVYITPIYNTGTASVSGTTVTGIGTEWNTADGALSIRKNVMPGDQIFFGSNLQNQPSANWHTIASVNSDTSLTLSGPGTTASADLYTIRKRAQGNADEFHWDFEIFPSAGPPLNCDAFFATNGVDPVVTWNPAEIFAKYQSDMPFTCFELRRFRNLMIYGELQQDGENLGTSIANSDNGLPLDLASGVAGQYIISDGPYDINWLGILGNNLMIYMGNMEGGSVVAAQFVGGATRFVFNEIIRGRGPIASRMVLEFPDHHEFLAMDGQYRYNGLYTQLMNPRVFRQVLPNFDRSRANRAFSQIIPQFGVAHIALPLQGDSGEDISTAYVESYLENPSSVLVKPITIREFPFVSVGQLPAGADIEYWNEQTIPWNIDPDRWNSNDITGAYAQQFAGDTNGKIYILFSSDLQAGNGFNSFALFSQRLAAGERTRALLRRVYPFVDYVAAGYDLTVTVNFYDQVGGPLARASTNTLALDYSGNRFVSVFHRGRLFEIMFGIDASGTTNARPWTLTGYDTDIGGTVSLGGMR